MNLIGCSLTLHELAGAIANGGPAYAIGIALNAPLAGTLTITGCTNLDGSPAPWVIGAGSAGYQPPPGSGTNGGGFFAYALSNPSDGGKATAFWRFHP